MNRQRVVIVSSSTTNLSVDLGIIEYTKCLELQRKLVSLRRSSVIPDILLFLEHDPPVYTIGRKADPSNFPGIDPVKTERGGDITFHGPGQLVIYPIFDMRMDGRKDVRLFVHRIEKAIISGLAALGLEAYVGEEPGIWVDDKKVASLGLAIDDYISYHGAAINYSPEILQGFSRIRPCGLDPQNMGFVDSKRDVIKDKMLLSFGEEFGEFAAVEKDLLLF
jgi:lipoyl(octanoyl) transferase